MTGFRPCPRPARAGPRLVVRRAPCEADPGGEGGSPPRHRWLFLFLRHGSHRQLRSLSVEPPQGTPTSPPVIWEESCATTVPARAVPAYGSRVFLELPSETASQQFPERWSQRLSSLQIEIRKKSAPVPLVHRAASTTSITPPWWQIYLQRHSGHKQALRLAAEFLISKDSPSASFPGASEL